MERTDFFHSYIAWQFFDGIYWREINRPKIFNIKLASFCRKSYWRLDWQILVNGTEVNPAMVAPLNTTTLSPYITFTGPHGDYRISHGVSDKMRLIPWSYYSWLFTMEWIPRSQYETFRLHLIQFYQRLYPGTFSFCQCLIFSSFTFSFPVTSGFCLIFSVIACYKSVSCYKSCILNLLIY